MVCRLDTVGAGQQIAGEDVIANGKAEVLHVCCVFVEEQGALSFKDKVLYSSLVTENIHHCLHRISLTQNCLFKYLHLVV